MSHLRAMLRATALAGHTGLVVLSWLATRPLGIVSARMAARTHAVCTRLWARGAARILGMRVEVRGRVPRSPFLLVTNHLSYVDVIALWTQTDATFLAKSDVAGWPVVGVLARSAGTLFVDRRRKGDVARAVREIEDSLAADRSVIVFPEGTSSSGASVLPFRPSLFEAAVRTGLPVHCASLAYATPPGGPPADLVVCWWGDMKFLGHLYALLSLHSFRAEIAFAREPLIGADRKILAVRARSAVSSELGLSAT